MDNQSDYIVRIKRCVRKTNIISANVDDVVDSKEELTQYFLEIFADGNLIFVRNEGKIYKVYSKDVILTKEQSKKLNEQIEIERQKFIEKRKNETM